MESLNARHVAVALIVVLCSVASRTHAQSTPETTVAAASTSDEARLDKVETLAKEAALAGHNAWMLTSSRWCCS